MLPHWFCMVWVYQAAPSLSPSSPSAAWENSMISLPSRCCRWMGFWLLGAIGDLSSTLVRSNLLSAKQQIPVYVVPIWIIYIYQQADFLASSQNISRPNKKWVCRVCLKITHSQIHWVSASKNKKSTTSIVNLRGQSHFETKPNTQKLSPFQLRELPVITILEI